MKIDFNYETEFELENELNYTDWINNIIEHNNSFTGKLSFIFCDDNYLLEINKKYLNHDTYTDIITFDYSDANTISGDIFISIERVRDNAVLFNAIFEEEFKRVISHGVLHLLGFNDKSDEERSLMRTKENEMIKLFHVEQ